MVTGRDGQLARSLAERGGQAELVFVGRPDFDLMDPVSIERTIERVRPDVIVNAAAYTAVDAAEDDADTAMAVNGVAPGVIADAATKVGARLIQISTDYVFDGTLDRPYREDDPTSPLGVYGRTKLAGELAVTASQADAAILRTAWVYGPFGNNFVKTMLRLADSRDGVAVVSDQHGSPTSSIDLAEAVLRLIAVWQREGSGPGTTIYHVAGSGATTWSGLARAVFDVRRELTGKAPVVREIATSDYPTKARRPGNSIMDCTKLATALHWTLPDWRDSVTVVTEQLLGDQRATTLVGSQT